MSNTYEVTPQYTMKAKVEIPPLTVLGELIGAENPVDINTLAERRLDSKNLLECVILPLDTNREITKFKYLINPVSMGIKDPHCVLWNVINCDPNAANAEWVIEYINKSTKVFLISTKIIKPGEDIKAHKHSKDWFTI